MGYFDRVLDVILEHANDTNKAAVAVIVKGNKVLMGLSKQRDDRYNKWCFPAGHITRTESPEEGAEREAREETGIKCKALKLLGRERAGKVIFFKCRFVNGTIRPNSEFKVLKFLSLNDLARLNIYKNNYSYAEKALQSK